jgi:acyl-CoA synthetase (AMP-forming)/AMP-acid ligase II
VKVRSPELYADATAGATADGPPSLVAEPSLLAVLHERAEQRPDATAFTYMDYGLDPSGFAESLTWAQVERRAGIVAQELRRCASIGDRVAILAPHGLDYVFAFLGVLQAGLIAVPLSAPQFGIHDERASSALRDSLPAAIVTTSAAAADVAKYVCARGPTPTVIEVDLLNFETPRPNDTVVTAHPGQAYLQYTSGTTRSPAGVIVSHRNVITNVEQMKSAYFGNGESVPPGVIVSWLPFFHDMGLILGICAPIIVGRRAVLLSPMSFLRRPASWMRLLATHPLSFSAAPNFAFEFAARRTSDEDMAGLDLGDVLGIISGSERIHAATIRRFVRRFAPFNLSENVIRPSYGLAEATLYVATAPKGRPPKTVRLRYEDLSAGRATPCPTEEDDATELVSYGAPSSPAVRIVDPDTRIETPSGVVGEIWVHGDNVSSGYWRKPDQTHVTFGAKLVNPSPGTPDCPWLRTGDLGVMSGGELFIIGRIKDLLIVDGRNHYPDDIEAAIQQITGGRVAAISIPDESSERLVVIVETRKGVDSNGGAMQRLRTLEREVAEAVSKSHGVCVADLVMVHPGSIPLTTSGKVRRSACVDRYRQQGFVRLDSPP